MRRRERLQRIALVPVRPFQRVTWSLGVFLLMLAAGVSGYWLGQVRPVPASAVSTAEVARREKAVIEQADVKLKACDIIEQASQSLQADNRELLASLAAIEERLLFYRRMAAPGAAATPVAIEQLELLPGRVPNAVHYRLLVARDDRGGTAPITITLVAGGAGASQTLQLSAPRFQFRYYQQYSGDWLLPSGVHPTRVDVQLRQAGRVISRRYKWELKS